MFTVAARLAKLTVFRIENLKLDEIGRFKIWRKRKSFSLCHLKDLLALAMLAVSKKSWAS